MLISPFHPWEAGRNVPCLSGPGPSKTITHKKSRLPFFLPINSSKIILGTAKGTLQSKTMSHSCVLGNDWTLLSESRACRWEPHVSSNCPSLKSNFTIVAETFLLLLCPGQSFSTEPNLGSPPPGAHPPFNSSGVDGWSHFPSTGSFPCSVPSLALEREVVQSQTLPHAL